MLNAPWLTVADITCGPCADRTPDPTPFLLIASEILYDLTEGAYPGVGVDTIRPPSNCTCGFLGTGDWWSGAPIVWPTGAGGILDGCGCSNLSEIVLPAWPVVAIDNVTIDGVVVDEARYRVDNHRRLVFQPDLTVPGRRTWPLYQRLDQPAGEQFTWTVTYRYGTAPPPGGVFAASQLACEYAMSCADDEDVRALCRLPRNTASTSRRNVAIAMVDPKELRENGETGIPEVDDWIRADRWARTHRGAAVLGPRRPRATRTTG